MRASRTDLQSRIIRREADVIRQLSLCALRTHCRRRRRHRGGRVARAHFALVRTALPGQRPDGRSRRKRRTTGSRTFTIRPSRCTSRRPTRRPAPASIVVPGGGHRLLVFKAEGQEPAEFLNGLGVAAFALKHRLAREEGSTYTIERDATADAYRALRLVRSRAQEWHLDPKRIGIMGFSAGGEVVGLVAYGDGNGDAQRRRPDRSRQRPARFHHLHLPRTAGRAARRFRRPRRRRSCWRRRTIRAARRRRSSCSRCIARPASPPRRTSSRRVGTDSTWDSARS